jgi:ABC-2 type transport system permease protein
MFTAVFIGMEVIWDRQFGFLKETLVTPVPRMKIMIGKTLGGATIALCQGLLIFLITLMVGFRPANWLLVPVAFLFMFLIAVMFTAFGTAMASKIEDMQSFPIITNFIVMPLFFLSGALFPLTGLSPILETIVKLNPLAYGIDGLHQALTSISSFSLLADFGVLIGVSAAFFLIGAYLFSKIEL